MGFSAPSCIHNVFVASRRAVDYWETEFFGQRLARVLGR